MRIVTQFPPNGTLIHEDKKWYKLQVDGVNTGALIIGDRRVLHTADKVHDELLTCNPHYTALTKHLVAKPRWLRTNKELLTTPRSSLVLALDDEQKAKDFLNLRSLVAFGRHCSLRAFQERPPVSQCRKCWSLDHITNQCKGELTCHLCSGPHTKTEHQSPNPAGCQRCSLAQENGNHMDTTAEGACPHKLKCANCCIDPKKDHDHPANSRRCPARLERYDTVRNNERHKIQTDSPWIKAKTKKAAPKKKKPTTSTTPNLPTPIQTGNRYEALTEQANEPLSQDYTRPASQNSHTYTSQQWY